MSEWVSQTAEMLWRNGLTAIPLVILTATLVKFLPCRPATRHTMWLVVLGWMVVPPLLPDPPTPQLATIWTDLTTREAKPLDANELFESVGEVLACVARTVPPQPVTVPRIATESFTPPSPRSAARPMLRTPEMLARATGVGGPLTLGSVVPRRSGLSTGSPRLESTLGELRSSVDRPMPRPSRVSGERSGHAATALREPTALDVDVVLDPPQVLEPKGTVASVSPPTRHDPPPLLTEVPTDVPLISSESVAKLADSLRPRTSLWPESGDLQAWAAGVTGVRDAVVELPPIPIGLWIGGTLLVLAFGLGHALRFRRQFRHAVPPPSWVVAMVDAASKELGLRRAPQTVMVPGRLSPMIWCGLKPRLILPAALWSRLGRAGQRAVLFHELAHVRRRDHWVCWIETLVGALYWWHPLVWWARKRLHAEADDCCDAWVTTLLPRTRRAYAEALLLTRQYVGVGSLPVPATGMGMVTGRARRFARRLTMVMTGSVKPRLSVSGMGLVLMLATTGWLTSPARSCPEEEKAKAAAQAKAAPCDKPCAKPCEKPCGKASATVVPTPAPEAEAKNTYETHMAAKLAALASSVAPAIRAAPLYALAAGRGGDDDDEDDDRIARLEERMERIGEKLERLMEAMENRHSDGEGHSPRAAAPRTPPPPRAPTPPHAPLPPMPAMAPMPPMPPMPGMDAEAFGPDGGEVSARTYKLSKGKLEALIALMSRPDVPVLIRAKEDGIEVNATPRQHRIFGAFVRIIDPGNESVGMGPASGDGPGRDRHMAADMRRHEKEMEKAAKRRSKEMEKREKRRSKAGVKIDEARTESLTKSQIQEELAQQAEALREQAEEMNERAEEIRGRTERIAERASNQSERDRRAELEREALALRHQAEAMDQERQHLEETAGAIEERSHEMEDEARQAEDQIRDLEEELQGLDEESDDDGDDDEHAAAYEWNGFGSEVVPSDEDAPVIEEVDWNADETPGPAPQAPGLDG